MTSHLGCAEHPPTQLLACIKKTRNLSTPLIDRVPAADLHKRADWKVVELVIHPALAVLLLYFSTTSRDVIPNKPPRYHTTTIATTAMASITSSIRSSMLRGSRFQLRPLTRHAFIQAYLFHTSPSYRALKEEDRRMSTQPYARIRLHIAPQLTSYPNRPRHTGSILRSREGEA